jgi:hypothetical protein
MLIEHEKEKSSVQRSNSNNTKAVPPDINLDQGLSRLSPNGLEPDSFQACSPPSSFWKDMENNPQPLVHSSIKTFTAPIVSMSSEISTFQQTIPRPQPKQRECCRCM